MYNAVLHECRDYEYDKVKEIIKKSINTGPGRILENL